MLNRLNKHRRVKPRGKKVLPQAVHSFNELVGNLSLSAGLPVGARRPSFMIRTGSSAVVGAPIRFACGNTTSPKRLPQKIERARQTLLTFPTCRWADCRRAWLCATRLHPPPPHPHPLSHVMDQSAPCDTAPFWSWMLDLPTFSSRVQERCRPPIVWSPPAQQGLCHATSGLRSARKSCASLVPLPLFDRPSRQRGVSASRNSICRVVAMGPPQ